MKKHPKKNNPGFTLVELLVVIAIIGILIAMLLPAVQAAREAARRMSCSNKIRQIAVAANNYHTAHNCFPPAYQYFVDNTGNLVVNGMLTFILPYMEQTSISDMYDSNKGYDHPDNQPAVLSPVSIYQCPSSPVSDRTIELYNWMAMYMGMDPNRDGKSQVTDYFTPEIVYVYNTDGSFKDQEGGALTTGQFGEKTTKAADISDGLSNTILMIESAGRPNHYLAGAVNTSPPDDFKWFGPWAGSVGMMVKPTNGGEPGFGTRAVGENNACQPYSFHPGGANVALCDGACKFIGNEIDVANFQAMCIRDDGQVVDWK